MPRDIEIIRAVCTHRALSTVQLDQLFFAGSTSLLKINPRCQHRLKLLYHAGFLDRYEQPVVRAEGSKPLVYFLDGAGAVLLAQRGLDVDWDPDDNRVSHQFLDHHLAASDIRIALTTAIAAAGFTLREWLDEKALKAAHQKDTVDVPLESGATRRSAIVPDGYFCLKTPTAVKHFFLEVDRGTETVAYSKEGKRDFKQKVKAYLKYFAKEGKDKSKFSQRYHADYARILTITTGDTRLVNLKRATEDAGGKSWFWFTTFERATPDSILTDPIWQIADKPGLHSLL